MAKKMHYILIITTIILLTFSISVLAEELNEEMYEGKEFRNPFLEYQEPAPEPQPGPNAETSAENREPEEPVITFEMVKNQIPFSLNGIISSSTDKIALLNTGEGTQFIRGYYKEDGYELIAIQGESVIVRNRGFRLRLKIGGEIDEI